MRGPVRGGAAVALVAAAALVAGCGPEQQRAATSSAPTSAASTAADEAGSTATSTSAAPTGPPAPGTVLLAALPDDGRVNVLSNGAGFTVLQSLTVLGDGGGDESTVTAYDAAGRMLTTIPAGKLSGECGAADVTPGGRRLIVTALISDQPAQGVNPELQSMALTAWDATTGAQAWTTQIVAPQSETTLSCSAFDGHLLETHLGDAGLAITSDGAWGALLDGDTPGVLDMATGKLYPKADVLGVLGTSVVTGTDDPNAVDPLATLTAPPGWAALGSFRRGVGPDRVDDVFLPAWAVSGVFLTRGRPGASTGITADGTALFALQQSRDGSTTPQVTAFALPAMTRLWSKPAQDNRDLYPVAEAGGVLLVHDPSSGGTGGATIGLDARTGAQKWSLPEVEVCGLTTTQLLVQANGQLAVIDLASGKQLSYREDPYVGGGNSEPICPTMLPGGVLVDPGSSTGAVTQALTP